MPASEATPARSDAGLGDRLLRLAAFQAADPGNEAILAELCDEALVRGRADVAKECIAGVRTSGLASPAWTFRAARTALLSRDLPQARELLAQARAEGAQAWLVDHDLACAAWLAGDSEGCRDRLEGWLREPLRSGLSDEAVQAFAVLWLRALHALGQVDEGCAWAQDFARQRALGRAGGPAALLNIDAGRFAQAQQLAREAMAIDPQQPEALLACATALLASGDANAAVDLLERLLGRCAGDGRGLSALGLAKLRLGEMAAAQRHLELAVAAMPGHLGSWHALGWARLAQADRAGALLAFAKAVEIDGNFAESHGAVGLVLLLQGDEPAASRHLATAARLEPGNLTGRLARALRRGEPLTPERLSQLAAVLLDRPGLFGGSMAGEVRAMLARTQ